MLRSLDHSLAASVELFVLRTDGACGPDDAPQAPEDCLDESEQQRAARFRRPGDSRRWARLRGYLRHLLAERCGRTPHELRFALSAAGRPYLLDDDGAASELQFNVSHSGEAALLALSRQHRLGVDVERVRAHPDLHALAATVFDDAEQAAFSAVAQAAAPTVFTRTWARKEAVVKADGAGLGFGMKRVSVGCAATPALLIDGQPSEDWQVIDITAPHRWLDGFQAALCVSASPPG